MCLVYIYIHIHICAGIHLNTLTYRCIFGGTTLGDVCFLSVRCLTWAQALWGDEFAFMPKRMTIGKPFSCIFNLTLKDAGSFSPPARWGLLDFMSVASSSCLPLPLPPSAFRLPPPASSSSSSSSLSSSSSSLSSSSCSTAIHVSVPCRTSTTTIHVSVPCRTSTASIPAQCSLPDLNHDHPRPVFPAGPQPRPSPPSVPCRTSTTTIHAQCSLPDLNREYPRQVFPAGPHVGRYGTKNAQKKVRKNVRKNVRRYAR